MQDNHSAGSFHSAELEQAPLCRRTSAPCCCCCCCCCCPTSSSSLLCPRLPSLPSRRRHRFPLYPMLRVFYWSSMCKSESQNYYFFPYIFFSICLSFFSPSFGKCRFRALAFFFFFYFLCFLLRFAFFIPLLRRIPCAISSPYFFPVSFGSHLIDNLGTLRLGWLLYSQRRAAVVGIFALLKGKSCPSLFFSSFLCSRSLTQLLYRFSSLRFGFRKQCQKKTLPFFWFLEVVGPCCSCDSRPPCHLTFPLAFELAGQVNVELNHRLFLFIFNFYHKSRDRSEKRYRAWIGTKEWRSHALKLRSARMKSV